ncbi:UPF0280 family protein [Leisingera sp. S232]|uniref:UPF0280 family protein n=1 Tax=Leisingera sp. S232 TaxID=3415132 RepID=UPI003C7AC51F
MIEPDIAAYRTCYHASELKRCVLIEEQSNLSIATTRPGKSTAHRTLLANRAAIKSHIAQHPDFLTSLVPVSLEDPLTCPEIIQRMTEASCKAGVGPMAAVAGAIADVVGKSLLGNNDEVIVENGGDIFCKVAKKRIVGIYAQNSSLSNRLGVVVRPEHGIQGICTSAGNSGGSLSFGKADACCVIAESAALADAVATATGNLVKTASGIETGLEFAMSVSGVHGAVILASDRIGAQGDIEIQEL